MLKLQSKAKGGGDAKPKANKCLLDKNLGFPVGLTQGNYNQNEMQVKESLQCCLSLASCHYAYAFSYIKSPILWTTKDINSILVAAKVLIPNLSQTLQNADDDSNLGQTILIQDYIIELETPKDAEVIGNIYNMNRPQVINTLKGLKRFFRRPNRACLFRSNAMLLLVWKTTGVYFVFDPRGRNETCCMDTEKGFASLICLETLKNVACLIATLSDLKPEEFYVMTALRVKNLIKGKNKTNDPTLPKSPKVDEDTYNVLSDKMAILNSGFNIANNCFKETRNFQTLTACCCAYVYSLIRPPNTWTSKTVDKVLLFGNQLYEGCVKLELPEQFSIKNIPPMITMATYRATLRINPYQNGGRMLYVLDHTSSELQKAMSQYFLEHNCVLLQVDQLYFSVWRRAQVFYLFDPYARNKNGETILGKDGAACVHMHSTMESLCGILYGNLMRIAEKERFYLHGLESCLLTDSGDLCGDVDRTSLNESVGSLFTPQLKCIGPTAEQCMCNLDSPTVSATQFIRPWHMMKGYAIDRIDSPKASESESSTSLSTESEFSFNDDDSQFKEPNNKLGLENSLYADLLKSGLTDEQIAAYHAMGITPKDMKKWAALGVGPDDVKRLRDAGIEMDEFKAMQKIGLTVDDCLKAKELKIPPKQFAKMKKLGVPPEEMLDFMANKANENKLRELKLSVCESEKLTKAGIGAEEYDAANKQGLTYEEIVYAKKHDIPVEEFVRQKSMDMTAVDIIKAKEMNITPEEYKKMKEDGVTPNEMDAVKQLEENMKPTDEQLDKTGEVPVVEKTASSDKIDPDAKGTPTEETKPKIDEKAKADEKSKIEDEKPNTEKDKAKIDEENTKNDEEKAKIEKEKLGTADETPKIEEEKPKAEERKSKIEEEKSKIEEEKSKIEEEPLKIQEIKESTKLDQKEDEDTKNEFANADEDTRLPTSSKNAIPGKTASIRSTSKTSSKVEPNLLEEGSRKKTPIQSNLRKSIGPKRNMAVIKSSTLSPISFQKLFTESFKMVDRVLVVDSENEPNCVAFRNSQGPPPPDQRYFLYEGCACNMDQIRRLDIDSSKRYLTRYPTMNTMIKRVIERMEPKQSTPPQATATLDEKRQVASYARELLDDKLNLINQQFNNLLKDFHSLSLEK